MSSMFNTPEHHQLVARYHVEQEHIKLVKLLQKTWPNIHVQFTDDYNGRVVSIIINDELIPVARYQRWERVSDMEIFNHILKYLKDLKKVKRSIIMKEILNVKEQ